MGSRALLPLLRDDRGTQDGAPRAARGLRRWRQVLLVGAPWVLEVSKHSELDIDRQNAERSRRGRTARARGNAFEREVAKRLGAARVGQFGGKQDVANEWIAVQCKVGKSYPERLDGWLRSVPVKGDQLAALVVGDSPGAGARRRTMIVLDLDDFIAWFGKEDNAKEEG